MYLKNNRITKRKEMATESNVTVVTDYKNATDITLDPPVQSDVNLLFLKLQNDGSEFYIQTPKMHYSVIDDHIKIYFKGSNEEKLNKFYEFVYNLESTVQSLTERVITEELDDDIFIQQLFKSGILLPSHLGGDVGIDIEIEPNVFKVYNKQQTEVSFETFVDGEAEKNLCTFIILCDGVEVTPTSARITWKVVQALLYKNKPKKLKGFGIQPEDSDENELKPNISLKCPSLSLTNNNNNNTKDVKEEETQSLRLTGSPPQKIDHDEKEITINI